MKRGIDHIQKAGVKKAKELLRNETYSIKQISGMVGYSEPNYFTWTFKKMEGMSPLKFRYDERVDMALRPRRREQRLSGI